MTADDARAGSQGSGDAAARAGSPGAGAGAGAGGGAALDPLLIEVLACPLDKGPLLWFEDEQLLYNPRLRKAYAVRDGIPVMLVDEATDVDAAEHERLTEKAEASGVPRTGSAGVS